MGNEKLRIPSSHLPVPEHQQELVERGVVEGILHWPNVYVFLFHFRSTLPLLGTWQELLRERDPWHY